MSRPSLAVVTGASSGIGRATALALCEDLPVIAVARRASQLDELAGQAPGEVRPVAADVTEEAGLAAVAAAVGRERVRYLVHGAGIYPIASLAGLDVATWRRVMATNVDARLFLTQRLRASFSAGSRVLFVGSLSAHRARRGALAYCTSKAASFMLQQGLRLELAEEGVLVANTYPGFVDTDLMRGAIDADRAVLPDAELYADAERRGELIRPQTVAMFFRYLLTRVEAGAYDRDDWKIADPAHHAQWLGRRPLYG